MSYIVSVGAIPDGQYVHHRCANRMCVNPDHLQLTTARENTAEMLRRRYYEARIAALEAEVLDLRSQLTAAKPRP
ncbi:MAG: HNH endonuclease [Pseudonocardia sp.]|nr:HNH endonuclease [Pseudonocardia sp.]